MLYMYYILLKCPFSISKGVASVSHSYQGPAVRGKTVTVWFCNTSDRSLHLPTFPASNTSKKFTAYLLSNTPLLVRCHYYKFTLPVIGFYVMGCVSVYKKNISSWFQILYFFLCVCVQLKLSFLRHWTTHHRTNPWWNKLLYPTEILIPSFVLICLVSYSGFLDKVYELNLFFRIALTFSVQERFSKICSSVSLAVCACSLKKRLHLWGLS